MFKSSNSMQTLVFIVTAVGGMKNASAWDQCPSSNSTQCWQAYSGPNYSQVVVGASGAGMGIACATHVYTNTSYNGDLDCYAPSGLSSAFVMGRAGFQVQSKDMPNNSVPFYGLDPNRRMMSLAISPEPGNSLTIWALRSDGQLYAATTPWPLGANPAIIFQPLIPTQPANLRSIGYVKGVGIAGITSDNMLYYRTSTYFPWTLVTSDAVMIASTADRIGSPVLFGQNSAAIAVGLLNGGVNPVPLPYSLYNPQGQLDDNIAFNWFGQLTPLAAGKDRILALLPFGGPGCPPTWTGVACILINHAHFDGGSSIPTGWSGWGLYATGALEYAPLSIQEASQFRGRDGEVWAITYSEHLVSWAP